MSQRFYEGGAVNSRMNYIGGAGTILWFNRLLDDTVDPVLYRGNRDLGNIKTSPSTLQQEEKPHYSARSGSKVEDDRLTIVTAEEFTITFDELSAENAFNYFRSATRTAIGASTGNTRTETVQLFGTETAWLSEYDPTAIVVKTTDGITTYTLTTDYIVKTHQLGYKGIRLPDVVGSIADGAQVKVTYSYKIRAHQQILPYTADAVEGEATIFGVSKTRGEFIRPYKRVRLQREGGFETKPDDWSEFQCKVTVLDASSQYPSMPWGIFQYYGLGKKIYDGSLA